MPTINRLVAKTRRIKKYRNSFLAKGAARPIERPSPSRGEKIVDGVFYSRFNSKFRDIAISEGRCVRRGRRSRGLCKGNLGDLENYVLVAAKGAEVGLPGGEHKRTRAP